MAIVANVRGSDIDFLGNLGGIIAPQCRDIELWIRSSNVPTKLGRPKDSLFDNRSTRPFSAAANACQTFRGRARHLRPALAPAESTAGSSAHLCRHGRRIGTDLICNQRTGSLRCVAQISLRSVFKSLEAGGGKKQLFVVLERVALSAEIFWIEPSSNPPTSIRCSAPALPCLLDGKAKQLVARRGV